MRLKHHDNVILIHFGKHLRALRKKKGYTQEAFAIEANLERAYYSRVEGGKVNISLLTLATIAKTLNVSMRELIPENISLD